MSETDLSAEEEGKCATVSVLLNVGENTDENSLSRLLTNYVATILSENLIRADVVAATDTEDLIEYLQTLQLFNPGDDPTTEEYHDAMMGYLSSTSAADLMVLPTVHGIGGTYVLVISAWAKNGSSILARQSATVAESEVVSTGGLLAASIAEVIKDKKHCLALTPHATVIDYDDADERTKDFEVEVKNLKDEVSGEGSVSFELASPEWGTLDASTKDVSDGLATVTFTMTKRKNNTLTATLSIPDEESIEDKSGITALCGMILSINGYRTFTVNQEPLSGFEAGSWWTFQGTSTVMGYVPLIDVDESDATEEMPTGMVFGAGWYTDDQNVPDIAALIILKDPDGNEIQCDISESEVGSSKGEWMVWGTKTDDTMTIQALGLGLSGAGHFASGCCPGLGSASISGGFGTYAQFGETSIEYEDGAMATASGNDGVSDYSYELKLYRAVK